MKNNPLDDIIKCSIEISNPVSDAQSFDSILVIVPKPTSSGASVENAFEIASAIELLDYGFTNDSVAFRAAQIAFAQNPAPSKLVIYARKVIESATETITTALTNAASTKGFYGVYLASFTNPSEIEEAAVWCESNAKLFAFDYTDINTIPINVFTYYRTFGIFAGLADANTQPEANNYMGLAWMAKCFGYNPGSETWAFKELATVAPSAITTAQKTSLEEKNISTYLRYAGLNITLGGKVLAGEWIDVIRFRDWLKSNIQTKVFNVLHSNRKVEYTDAGISLIENAIEVALREGQEIGGIADTSYDANGNEIPGYTISVPKAAEVSDEQKKSRTLVNCKWTAKLAGAIHAVEIEGYLTF